MSWLIDKENYFTAKELRQIVGIIEFLKKASQEDESLSFEIRLFDANGDELGMIKDGDGEYALYLFE